MLGYIGLAYGVGFLVGPGLGGMVSSSHLQNSAWLATLGSLVSMAMVLRYLPASRTLAPRPPPKADGGGMEDGSGRSTAARPISRFDLREMQRVCTIKGVPSLLAVKLLSGLGSGLFHAIFALVAEERFQLTPGETGLVMSFLGGLTMLSQVPPGNKRATCYLSSASTGPCARHRPRSFRVRQNGVRAGVPHRVRHAALQRSRDRGGMRRGADGQLFAASASDDSGGPVHDDGAARTRGLPAGHGQHVAAHQGERAMRPRFLQLLLGCRPHRMRVA